TSCRHTIRQSSTVLRSRRRTALFPPNAYWPAYTAEYFACHKIFPRQRRCSRDFLNRKRTPSQPSSSQGSDDDATLLAKTLAAVHHGSPLTGADNRAPGLGARQGTVDLRARHLHRSRLDSICHLAAVSSSYRDQRRVEHCCP